MQQACAVLYDIMEYDICTNVSKVTAASTFTATDAIFTVATRSDLLQTEERNLQEIHPAVCDHSITTDVRWVRRNTTKLY
jgi:hypothetical protein